MNIDSIIFDLDGTLWDSTEVVVKAWNDVLKTYKEIDRNLTTEDLKGIMGLQIKDIGEKLFPNLDENLWLELAKTCGDVECEYITKFGGKLYKNIEQSISALAQNYKLFIVSNCQCGYIEAFYEAHKLNKYFVDFENPGRTGLSKGENIKLIINRNKLESPIYIGDTQGDLNAARYAKIPFVHAKYGFGSVSQPDYVIDNIDELLEIVK